MPMPTMKVMPMMRVSFVKLIGAIDGVGTLAEALRLMPQRLQ
jgi:hypothetical protein